MTRVALDGGVVRKVYTIGHDHDGSLVDEYGVWESRAQATQRVHELNPGYGRGMYYVIELELHPMEPTPHE